MSLLNSAAESRFSLLLLICSSQVFNGLDQAHMCWKGQSALLSLPIQMLI